MHLCIIFCIFDIYQLVLRKSIKLMETDGKNTFLHQFSVISKAKATLPLSVLLDEIFTGKVKVRSRVLLHVHFHFFPLLWHHLFLKHYFFHAVLVPHPSTSYPNHKSLPFSCWLHSDQTIKHCLVNFGTDIHTRTQRQTLMSSVIQTHSHTWAVPCVNIVCKVFSVQPSEKWLWLLNLHLWLQRSAATNKWCNQNCKISGFIAKYYIITLLEVLHPALDTIKLEAISWCNLKTPWKNVGRYKQKWNACYKFRTFYCLSLMEETGIIMDFVFAARLTKRQSSSVVGAAA